MRNLILFFNNKTYCPKWEQSENNATTIITPISKVNHHSVFNFQYYFHIPIWVFAIVAQFPNKKSK